MKFCINCHTELNDDDVFCKRCGTKVEAADLLSPEESIVLTRKLEKSYGEWEAIKNDLFDCQRDLPRYKLPANRPRYAAFRFFWPFLIYSQLAALAAGLTVFFLFLGSASSSYRALDILENATYVVAFIAEVVVLIVGGIYATRKRDNLNSQLLESERSILQKQHNIEARITELKSKRAVLERELKQYDGWLPVKMRNPHSIAKVRSFIERGEAKNLYEAVQMYQGNK